MALVALPRQANPYPTPNPNPNPNPNLVVLVALPRKARDNVGSQRHIGHLARGRGRGRGRGWARVRASGRAADRKQPHPSLTLTLTTLTTLATLATVTTLTALTRSRCGSEYSSSSGSSCIWLGLGLGLGLELGLGLGWVSLECEGRDKARACGHTPSARAGTFQLRPGIHRGVVGRSAGIKGSMLACEKLAPCLRLQHEIREEKVRLGKQAGVRLGFGPG